MPFDILSTDGIVSHNLHLCDRVELAAATELMSRFGEHALVEAASRADRSRSLGNVVHFCRWRQVERTILMLSEEAVTGTVH